MGNCGRSARPSRCLTVAFSHQPTSEPSFMVKSHRPSSSPGDRGEPRPQCHPRCSVTRPRAQTFWGWCGSRAPGQLCPLKLQQLPLPGHTLGPSSPRLTIWPVGNGGH